MEHTLTDEQNLVLLRWSSSPRPNLKVSAVCGAGKSTVLLACAEKVPGCVLVTYNKRLQEELAALVSTRGLDVQVFTFHGLCSKLSGRVCRDDMDLEMAQVEPMQGVSALLLDEVQDMRGVYVHFLRRAGLLQDIPCMIVGDLMQLICDFDRTYPAEERFMHTPKGNLKPSHFLELTLSTSHRFGAPTAAVLNCVTQPPTPVRVTRPSGPKVRVVAVGNSTTLKQLIASCLRKWNGQGCILSQWVRGNFKLQEALHALSSEFCFHVHGLDGNDPKTVQGKVRVSSWHSAKGLTFKNALVLGVDERANRKPLHVAMSRATDELVLAMDTFAPCKHVLRAILDEGQHIDADSSCMAFAAQVRADGSLPWQWATPARDEPGARFRSELVDLDAKPLPMRQVYDKVQVSPVPRDETHGGELQLPLIGSLPGGTWEVLDDVYTQAVSLKLEHLATGKLWQVNDLHQPTFLNRADQVQAVLRGSNQRFNLSRTDKVTLQRVKSILSNSEDTLGPTDYCYIACALLSSRGYKHRTAALALHVHSWCDSAIFDTLYARAAEVIPLRTDVAFDKRFAAQIEGQVLHCRCTAVDAAIATAWLLILSDCPEREFTASSAAIFACNDAINTVVAVNLASGDVWKCTCGDRAGLRNVASEM